MSLAQIKTEATALTLEEQRSLMAFLGSLEIAHDQALREELTRSISDTQPANWISLEQLKQRWAD